MRDDTRRGVAYVVGRLAGNASGAVYDHGVGCASNFAGDVDQDVVRVYDYERRAHLSGGRAGGGFSLFDHAAGARIHLSVLGGGRFVGYDYDTKSYFEVRAQARDVEVYDRTTGQRFNYSL
jgi:hypothetical protein